MSLPRYRGIILPAKRPPGDARRCHWGPCEAGGWILPAGRVAIGEHGTTYHPGCLAAMEEAHRSNRLVPPS